MTAYRVGVVGVTGLLGGELLRILAQRRFPVRALHAFASDRSVGQRVPFGENELVVERPVPGVFKHLDLVFLAAGREVNTDVLPHARNAGCMVINVTGRENVSETTPLVIPEVNEEVLANGARIVACPHDLTIQLCLVLAPLHKLNPVRRVTVTALCAVGAAGTAAIRGLTDETQAVLQGREPVAHTFSHPIAFNLLPEVNVFHSDGYSREEWLLAQETKQVLRAPELRLSATAVRAPVYQAHTQNVHAEFSRLLSADDARRVLSKSPGLRVQDDPVVSLYPHPVGVVGQDSVAVGRIRDDSSSPYGLVFWSAMDHLRKGSALNAVQIAEALASRDTI
jgi:aspartate-semialdehyde dehydrogenase